MKNQEFVGVLSVDPTMTSNCSLFCRRFQYETQVSICTDQHVGVVCREDELPRFLLLSHLLDDLLVDEQGVERILGLVDYQWRVSLDHRQEHHDRSFSSD